MKRLNLLLIYIALFSFQDLIAQDPEKLPFGEISEYPESYTANSVAARMIESLGFRYYWASKDLTTDDLEFQLSDDTRSMKETLEHIYDLSILIKNSAELKENDRSTKPKLSYEELRKATLLNLKIAFDIIGNANGLDSFEIKFGTGSYPFWHHINGPISDALWHCGTVGYYETCKWEPHKLSESFCW